MNTTVDAGLYTRLSVEDETRNEIIVLKQVGCKMQHNS